MNIAPHVWDLILPPNDPGPVLMTNVEDKLLGDPRIKALIQAALLVASDETKAGERLRDLLRRKGYDEQRIASTMSVVSKDKAAFQARLARELRVDPVRAQEALDHLKKQRGARGPQEDDEYIGKIARVVSQLQGRD